MNIFLEFLILFILAVLVVLTHKKLISLDIVSFEGERLEKIEENLKLNLNVFLLKILRKIKIINLQFSNFLDQQVQKISQNATQKNEISKISER